jgi:hypothetical protein
VTQMGLLDTREPEPELKPPPDFWNLLAASKGVPAGWQWFRLVVADVKAPREKAHSLVTGAVCTERFKGGPRKGGLNWAKRDKRTERTLVIAFAEFDAFIAQWEAANAACSSCGGNGHNCGTRPEPCYRCKGSGKPRVTTAAEPVVTRGPARSGNGGSTWLK